MSIKILVLGQEADEKRHFGDLERRFDCGIHYRWVRDQPLPGEIVEEVAPDIMVVSREWSPEFRLAIAAAKKQKIPVLYIVDGVLEWSYLWRNYSYVRPEGTVLQPLMSDAVCCVGDHQARLLASIGLGARTCVVGLPRLDPLQHKKKFALDKTAPTVLVCTPRTFSHGTEQDLFVRRALRDLRNWEQQQSLVGMRWRIDPELASELGVEVDSIESVEESILDSNCVISFVSTVLLEAMALDRPVCAIDYRNVPILVQTAWQVRSAETIEPVIYEMLHPPEEKLVLQKFYLEDELKPGNATDRLGDLITSLVANGPESIEDAELTFGVTNFRNLNPQISTFGMSSRTILEYELDGAYKHLRELKETKFDVERQLKHTLTWKVGRLFTMPIEWFLNLFSTSE